MVQRSRYDQVDGNLELILLLIIPLIEMLMTIRQAEHYITELGAELLHIKLLVVEYK
jgi:hypothetical protein